MSNIRIRVREVAESRGITIAQLSYATRISRQALYPIWKSESKRISLETFEKIAVALGVQPKELIDGGGPSDPQ